MYRFFGISANDCYAFCCSKQVRDRCDVQRLRWKIEKQRLFCLNVIIICYFCLDKSHGMFCGHRKDLSAELLLRGAIRE